jgi:hypothetical protein
MKLTLVIALALFGACCTAGDSSAQQVERIYELQLPANLGAFSRGGVIRNYEERSPGLGYSAAYHKPCWTMTVYFYDKGMRTIGNGATDASVLQEYEEAKQNIVDAGKNGAYSAVEWKREFYAPDSGAGSRFICSHFELKFSQDRSLSDSFVCITGWKNKFVKLRISGSHDANSVTEANMAAEGWMRILMGEAPAP